jgi:uncharacterized protein (TIGR02231 family)
MPTIETSIAAVTVYNNQARITRRGKIQVQPGEQTLVLKNLPVTLEEDSVRASGRGAGVTVLGVDVKTEFVAEAPEEIITQLKHQRDQLSNQDQTLVSEDAALLSHLDFLTMLRDHGGVNFGKAIATGRAGIESVTGLSRYLTEETSAANKRRSEIVLERQKLEQEIKALDNRIRQQSFGRERRREIHVLIEAEAEVEFELDILYAVTNASWMPLYDVRLTGTDVTLTYLAIISQRSGEDWPEVDLSLSTARPALTTGLPELQPWYLDRIQTVMLGKARGGFQPQRQMETAATLPYLDLATDAIDELARPAAAPAPQAKIAQAAIENTGGAAVNYRVSKPVAVPSDGTPHKTTVTAFNLSAKLDYVTAPKMAEEAYLRATITNTSDFILLPGNASIFHGVDFVGKTYIENTALTEEFEAQLGVDDRIKVKRELVKRDVGKNLIGNTRRTQFAYKITLQNLLATEAKITVFDQLPLGRHEEIKVKLENISPEPAERSELNIVKWILELKPGEKRDITFAFFIEHPRTMTITGLDR